MPVVTFASPKGGAGKTTSAILFATQSASSGIPVTMIDADRTNNSLSIWRDCGNVPEGIQVITGVTEKSIVKTIKEHDQDGTLVVVDLEGIASQLTSRAMSKSDLVVIPMRTTSLDAKVGLRAIEMIQEEEEALERDIPHAIVFTATDAMNSKERVGIEESLRKMGVDIIKPDIAKRAAYSAIFAYGGDLESIPPQGNMENARLNASGYAEAVYKRLVGE